MSLTQLYTYFLKITVFFLSEISDASMLFVLKPHSLHTLFILNNGFMYLHLRNRFWHSLNKLELLVYVFRIQQINQNMIHVISNKFMEIIKIVIRQESKIWILPKHSKFYQTSNENVTNIKVDAELLVRMLHLPSTILRIHGFKVTTSVLSFNFWPLT